MNFRKLCLEEKQSKDILEKLVNIASNYDIYDFISKISGLNLMSENQNKSVLLDTLIQYVLAKNEQEYMSTNKMSAGKFKLIINELNSTYLSVLIDPCENVFVQNVMLGDNYRVFNGINITPAYNLQTLIRVLFQYQNDFDEQFLMKSYRLISFILGVSEEISRTLGVNIEKVKYDEQKKIILPSDEEIKIYQNKVIIPLYRVERYIADYFQIEDITIDFGKGDVGDLDNRPFYLKPFLINKKEKNIIILNISILPTFTFYKVLEWAEDYYVKESLINRFNEYSWLETKKALDKLGHKKIDNKALGIECLSEDYYKEMITTVYNDKLMAVFFMCDDGYLYPRERIHMPYPDKRHNTVFRKRLKYFGRKIKQLDMAKEDWYVMIVVNSYGREMGLKCNYFPFGHEAIAFNTFELQCISIKEKNVKGFFPRYIRSKKQMNVLMPHVFSELNSVCIYTSNNYTFYITDDIDIEKIKYIIGPGDSIYYITEALIEENRILSDSYIDGEKTEIILNDKVRDIYVEDDMFSHKYIAFCVLFENVKIWVRTEEIECFEQINIYCSLVDCITYWLAECRQIVEKFVLPYSVYVLHISLTGEIQEYAYQKSSTIPYEICIEKTISSNHIFFKWKPEAYCNMNQPTNSQEKELCKFLLRSLENSSCQKPAYKELLDSVFCNPLKKKFYAFAYENNPYLKPVNWENNRKVHVEDEDHLTGMIGKELLKTGEWEIGIVPIEKRNHVSRVVVDWLYQRLQDKISEFSTQNMLEIIYLDLEETLYKLILSERRFYSDIACYPEKEEVYIDEYNSLNRTSLALKFLIEYVTAQPGKGKKQLSVGQYEELLAICAMIIEWAYKDDLFKYEIVNTPIEFLKSKRIGLRKDEFIDMYQYGDVYRRRQLRYNSSAIIRKHYNINVNDYSDELEKVYEKEFGYKYSDFVQVIATMVLLNEGEIACVEEVTLPSRLSEINCSLKESVVEKVIEDIVYRPRTDYLILSSKYKDWEAYPWRFNRRYSFNRRPVLQRDENLIWGNRQLYHMLEYVTDLIYSGRFFAESKEMKELVGKISKNRGAIFNQLVFNVIQDMNEFKLDSNVKKVNGKKIADSSGKDLGDIDILIIDEKKNRIIIAEVKDFHYSRNPYEIQQEYIKMFVDKDKKTSFQTKHKRRVEWIKEHIQDVKKGYGLDDKEWYIKGVFLVSEPLISGHIYKQNIKCISMAELCVETIRKI